MIRTFRKPSIILMECGEQFSRLTLKFVHLKKIVAFSHIKISLTYVIEFKFTLYVWSLSSRKILDFYHKACT